MAIWHTIPDLKLIQARNLGSLVEHLGIQVEAFGDDFLCGKMPVDQRTRQPAGVLHGGASVAFAETLGTWGAVLTVDPQKYHCVGMEINANHLRAVKEGWVYGTARPIHLGRTTQVWSIEIQDEQQRMCCVSRLTVACLEIPSQY
ncbi:MAG TPA: hotdog fold thioesterase [Pirellulaceae bacterium]|nr:hotdog fold thioesterase [Pirellulaceae bacterium]HMO93910.1 hotdog fold thioesterase [Pirellulaceae bacterium]HMP68948.1 hotdog fold thioesterase [Pirellulaceae bacterium]